VVARDITSISRRSRVAPEMRQASHCPQTGPCRFPVRTCSSCVSPGSIRRPDWDTGTLSADCAESFGGGGALLDPPGALLATCAATLGEGTGPEPDSIKQEARPERSRTELSSHKGRNPYFGNSWQNLSVT